VKHIPCHGIVRAKPVGQIAIVARQFRITAIDMSFCQTNVTLGKKIGLMSIQVSGFQGPHRPPVVAGKSAKPAGGMVGKIVAPVDGEGTICSLYAPA